MQIWSRGPPWFLTKLAHNMILQDESHEPPTSSDVFPDPNSWQVTIFGQSAGAGSVAWVNPCVILVHLLRWSKELWNTVIPPKKKYEKDTYCMGLWKFFWYISMEKTVIPPKKKVKCCYWTFIYSTRINDINGSTGARSCWPLTIPLNQSFDHSVNQQDSSISQPTTHWLTHFLTHSITQSTSQPPNESINE